MLSYASIQAFTRRCSELPSLDIAILNAGITQTKFAICKETGHEEMLQVNYLSTVLLATLLVPILKEKNKQASTVGRLTIVASGTAYMAKFANHAADPLLASFDSDKGWNMNAAVDRYSTSKLMVLMGMLKLSERVDPREVVVNCVDPG